MIIVRGVAAAAVFSTIAVWSAGPAEALGPPADGMYTYSQPGVPTATWRMQVLCDQVNGSRYINDYSNPDIQANFCVVDVTSTMGNNFTRAEKMQNFSGRARLVGQRWTFEIGQTEGVSCPDGSAAPSTETYAFDDESLTGTHTSLHGAVCGMQPTMTKQPFTLTLAGPPPSPPERYPLYCDNIARCW